MKLTDLPPSDPEARCKHCRRTTDLVQHDGDVVCASCIRELGALALDPHDVDTRILAAVTERHGDVIRLSRSAVMPGRPSRLVWEWVGWP